MYHLFKQHIEHGPYTEYWWAIYNTNSEKYTCGTPSKDSTRSLFENFDSHDEPYGFETATSTLTFQLPLNFLQGENTLLYTFEEKEEI